MEVLTRGQQALDQRTMSATNRRRCRAMLAARQYFHGSSEKEQELYRRISKLWETVEWDWYRETPQSGNLYWHWSPQWAWAIHHPLIGF